MKKKILILGSILVALSGLVFGFTDWTKTKTPEPLIANNETLATENQNTYGPQPKQIPNLIFSIGTRFTPIKKIDIAKATTIYDFLSDEEKQQIKEINSVKITLIKDNQLSQISAHGTSDWFNEGQLNLIKTTDYFNHFTIRTEFKAKNAKTGKLESHFFGPHITVVPNEQATHVKGIEALIHYIETNIKNDLYDVDFNHLGALKISFVITTDGKISKVKHDAMTTRYLDLDKKLMTLVKNMPGKWIPAKNSEGENIEQELVFTFGPADGC